jgi:tetratricopeptide (TPR) repeat protein
MMARFSEIWENRLGVSGMALRSLSVICLALLAASPLLAGFHSQSGSQTDRVPSATVQAPQTVANAVVAPTLAEMRAMSPDKLDEEGDRLRAIKDYLSALDCYREAIRKHAIASYYNKVAITDLMLRHPEEATTAAKKAVHKDKKMAEAWNNLGVAYYMRGKVEDAIRTYARAISLQPGSASFHNNLAAALIDAKQFQRGVGEYRKAFELDPGFFEHSAVNGISARMGSPEDRAQFSFIMARLFASTGDTERALHFLRSAMEEGYPKIDEVYRDKEFEPVRNDQRFLALMKDRPVGIK